MCRRRCPTRNRCFLNAYHIRRWQSSVRLWADRQTGNTGGDAVGEVLYYQEFYWANYLRPLVYWDTTGTTNVTLGMDPTAANAFTNYDQLTLFAANLARNQAAADLPGYLGPVPEPSTGLLLVLGAVAVFFVVRRRKMNARS